MAVYEFFYHLSKYLSCWHQRSSTRRQLLRLENHELKDVGISPNEALAECNKPFWEK
ncbi:DUF1127 domain-containing protein [Spartinivicinus ruber]|uniref:DUF1127 domain-containing protein n=1 Tax=Spartinivicinus ruber TaxID=2683272 RepID=UPI0013D88FA6|nr:DUF1127 domain-containing protein [Spartinivicinus ruber]